METTSRMAITVEAVVNASIEKVWASWTEPKHITKWNQASDDWHCPKAANDLKTGGKFSATMAAKDGSMSFDFEGTYTNVKSPERLEYKMPDERKVLVVFSKNGNQTKVVETFDPETENPIEMQRQGWQAILDNFKKYTESLS